MVVSQAETIGKKDLSVVLGVSGQAVDKRANKENWAFKWETVRGGKRKGFFIYSLPEEVKIALAPSFTPTVQPVPPSLYKEAPSGAIELSDAETLSVTDTILWFGGHNTLGVAMIFSMVGGVISLTVTVCVCTVVFPLPSS